MVGWWRAGVRWSGALVAGAALAVGCGSDPEPPRVDINAPTDGAALFGAARVAVSVTGAKPAAVELYADRADAAGRIGAAVAGDGDYRATWFTTDVADGSHTLIARIDVDGELVEETVAVTVDNPIRADAVPTDAVKMTPATDAHPPVLEPSFATLFDPCEPLAGPINTAGAEDAPYITEDGQELYFFFTPDAAVPPNEQLVDRVTGIYRSVRDGAGWGTPERVWLSHHDDPALDGCETVYGDELWFCTARAGVERSIDIYVAHRDGDHWVDWATAGRRLNIDLELGELHIADGGDSIYYHSERAGGQGGIDLWVTRRDGGDWGDPVNLAQINSELTDGWPWVSPDGQELWYTSGPAAPELWRAVADGAGGWQAPEKVVAPFAGESTFDADGNLYFAHHFWDDDTSSIIEADIYICRRK